MYKKLTEKERLRNLASENALLSKKNVELEEAILELAQLISEAKDGEVVLQQN